MAVDCYHSCEHEEAEEEEYIDMEITTYTNFHCQSSREFEFQMPSSSDLARDISTASPADELFYKGKLLPLHLPPRLQMVEKLLQNSNLIKPSYMLDESFSTPLGSTPFESCNISPSESCQLSRELDPDEYFREEMVNTNEKKHPWARKLKLIKQSSIGSKLKASGAYLKSLFGNKGSLDYQSSGKNKNESKGNNETSVQFGQIRSLRKEETSKGSDRFGHRRSFSGAFKWRSMAKPLSSSSSSSSSSNDMQALKRSSSTRIEIESPIQGAIAHCKQSHQSFRSTKTDTELGLTHSSSTSSFSVCDELMRPEEHCRG